MHHILGVLAGLALAFIVAKGFFGSFWRAPPKREEFRGSDYSDLSASNFDPPDHHGSN